MSRTDRLTHIAVSMATFLGILSLSGLYSHAGDVGRAGSAQFAVTKNSVLGGNLPIGDLSVEGELEADSSAASAPGSWSELQRCIQEGPDWLRLSEDGTTLEVRFPWGSTPLDQVLTTYCDDGIILVGGYRQTTSDDDPSRRKAWLFSMVSAIQSSPTKMTFTKAYSVGSWARETRYTLNEVRSIDPASGRILFSGTSENGERALLSAPFASGLQAGNRH